MNDTRLTAEQFDVFNRDGVLRLPGFIPGADALAMADRVWADLGQRYAIDRQDTSTWTVIRPASFQKLERGGAFKRLDRPAFRALFDEFLGLWDAPKWWGQALVTFPERARRWDVPHQHWHLDLPPESARLARRRDSPLPCLRVFVFLNDVQPTGGGTLYIEGSHKVAADRAAEFPPGASSRSADLRERLKAEEPWLAALWSAAGENRIERFMGEGAIVRGVDLKVKEMTGGPGDAIVMHPATFHTFAPNVLTEPRLMVVQALYRRDCAWEIRL